MRYQNEVQELFTNAGVVLDVKWNGDNVITITFENNKLTMVAEGFCCSRSVFDQVGDFHFDKLIGKRILYVNQDIDINETYNKIECIRTHQNDFVIRDNQNEKSEFPFLLINESNGYYDGYIEYQWENKFKTRVLPPSAELVVVVGLPAAGKTCYVLQNYFGYTIYDDEENPISNIDYIIEALYKGEKICMIEPRFTDYNIYKKYIRDKVLPLIGESHIRTVLFNKDVENSHINNRRRMKDSIDKAKAEGSTRLLSIRIRHITLAKKNDIERMATYYSVENDYINKEIIDTVKN